MKTYLIGDIVEIVSKGHGKTFIRKGIVSEIVKAGDLPHEIELATDIGDPRSHESYVVFTSTKGAHYSKLVGGKFDKATDRYFWPRVGNISLIRRYKKK